MSGLTKQEPCHHALQSVSKSLAAAMTEWMQGLDTMGTEECQLKLLSIRLALKKVNISVEEAKAITKAMIRHAGGEHSLIELFDSSFFEGDLFKLDGGAVGLPLKEMRRYIRALEIADGGKYKMVLAKPECSYIKVEMPVYVPDAETKRLMRYRRAKRAPQDRRCWKIEERYREEVAPTDVELDWVSNDSEDWEIVGKTGKHK